ncbi:uncharacterized protein MELLADRAFT_104543 [Melampsora larici-populina 98AG31]|uniref:Uncharacterized protein n=1 Tax=Melampsora larici-populina (strain 98AG31 / pathotype 3-4-7) TaxID=747676 RepID=F4RF16_MELLP|nr:uncharacterized protein MELLADRAFT_104543 [Melampsora larici-populina 98AG31]EGG08739.1 hypothetical protein MELLADRAFT_104543 [Melampsora larici-populina 98AG31]
MDIFGIEDNLVSVNSFDIDPVEIDPSTVAILDDLSELYNPHSDPTIIDPLITPISLTHQDDENYPEIFFTFWECLIYPKATDTPTSSTLRGVKRAHTGDGGYGDSGHQFKRNRQNFTGHSDADNHSIDDQPMDNHSSDLFNDDLSSPTFARDSEKRQADQVFEGEINGLIVIPNTVFLENEPPSKRKRQNAITDTSSGSSRYHEGNIASSGSSSEYDECEICGCNDEFHEMLQKIFENIELEMKGRFHLEGCVHVR